MSHAKIYALPLRNATVFDTRDAVARIRAEAYDLPIGSPIGGAPYGQRLKSKGLGMVIGVVAAVATAGAGLSLMAGTGLMSQIAGGAMLAGGVMSGVGVVTGNKKLARMGAVMSLAGGVGGLAANAGAFGGLNAAGTGSESLSTFASSTKDSITSAFGGSSSAAGGMAEAAKAGEVAGAAGDAAAASGTAGGAPVTDAVTRTVPVDAAAGTGAGASTAAAPGTQAAAPVTNLDVNAAPGVAGAAGGSGGSGGGLLGRVMESKSMENVLGGAARGLGEGLLNRSGAEAQANAADAQTDYTKLRTEELRNQMMNANSVATLLDPNDPMFAQKKAQLDAQGKKYAIMPKYGTPSFTPVEQTARNTVPSA